MSILQKITERAVIHYWVYGLAALVVCMQFLIISKGVSGKPPKKWENYSVYMNSGRHLLEGKNLYAAYPEEQRNGFKYSPAFAFAAILPGILPAPLTLVIFLLMPALLLVYAVHRLSWPGAGRSGFFLAFLLMQSVVSMESFQTNLFLSACLILFLAELERGNSLISGLSLALCMFIKPYLLGMVLLYFLYPNKARNFTVLFLWCLLIFLLPVPLTGIGGLMRNYAEWYDLILHDKEAYLGMSFFGILAKVFGLHPAKEWILLPLPALLIIPFIRRKQISAFTVFSSLLIASVVFNPKAESNTYLLAMCGTGIWAFQSKMNTKVGLLLGFSLLFTSIAVSDLVPYAIRDTWVYPYCFPAIAALIVWINIQLEIFSAGWKPAHLYPEKNA